MNIQYCTQPDRQLGNRIMELLNSDPPPNQSIFVSAFVKLQTIFRLKRDVLNLLDRENDVRFIVGINLGGTSQEVLQELLSWNVEVLIFRHRNQRYTFHPKIYFFQWDNRAEVILGSNNLTEGGFFSNYEAFVDVRYTLPEDLSNLRQAKEQLMPFINPHGNIARPLTDTYLEELITQSYIPTEAETRGTDNEQASTDVHGENDVESLFGTEEIPASPPIPGEFTREMIQYVQHSRRARRREQSDSIRESASPVLSTESTDLVEPSNFFMTLPKMQGENIPGEARVPLDALEIAQAFWGWPFMYEQDVSPRAGDERVYWNWYPVWRIWSVSEPGNVHVQEVRMYFYENSSDFRFYARPLVNFGADSGDIVKIRKLDYEDIEYECVLARQGTDEHKLWLSFCDQPVRSSTRRFGYR